MAAAPAALGAALARLRSLLRLRPCLDLTMQAAGSGYTVNGFEYYLGGRRQQQITTCTNGDCMDRLGEVMYSMVRYQLMHLHYTTIKSPPVDITCEALSTQYLDQLSARTITAEDVEFDKNEAKAEMMRESASRTHIGHVPHDYSDSARARCCARD
ncbi:uncharacterized protein BXZ73DRAFT_77683 [Epithele typhae]|uniref:uncharacterized protein n=1 Tax=Epithele typhae TaxID=378194 RepID=UPI002008C46A|nr:uncharacterized protein BXZ73DRAFT_77683 [Epithele typhae]KAH9931658.1 hypothetical protein BXZ73DRAFT_77683 [Epithele typhae]